MKTMTNPKITKRNDESGAALIALLAAMALIAIVLLAVAPSVQQQIIRERELESIRRGDEIADAIHLYIVYNNGKLPQKMDDLLDGVNVPGRTKKMQILRVSAAKDPISSSGEWKLVQSRDDVAAFFVRGVIAFNGVTPASPSGQIASQVYNRALQEIISKIPDEEEQNAEPEGGEDDSSDSDVPFIGVVSRSKTKSVLTFYGIERHDRWIYTPLFRGSNPIPITLPTPTPER